MARDHLRKSLAPPEKRVKVDATANAAPRSLHPSRDKSAKAKLHYNSTSRPKKIEQFEKPRDKAKARIVGTKQPVSRLARSRGDATLRHTRFKGAKKMLKHDTPDNNTALSTGEAYQLFQDWDKGNEIPEDHYDHLRGRRSSSLPNRRIFSVRTTAFKQPAPSSLALQPANVSTIQLSTQSPPLDDKIATILAFDEPNKLMKFATTIEKQVARPNKGFKSNPVFT